MNAKTKSDQYCVIPSDDDLQVAAAMARYGGSFVSRLGEAFPYADPENRRRIKATWPEYWARYQQMVDYSHAAREGQ